jgi:hypothetical protein
MLDTNDGKGHAGLLCNKMPSTMFKSAVTLASMLWVQEALRSLWMFTSASLNSPRTPFWLLS